MKKQCFTVKMALELSRQAFTLCYGKDASALQALLDAHPAGIDLYLFERVHEFERKGTFLPNDQYHGHISVS
jgi:hypothetical protein